MPVILHTDIKLTVDEDGCLADLEDRLETVARVLAAENQLDTLKFMREYYKKHKLSSIVRYVCRNVHKTRNCVTDKFMNLVTA